MSKFYVLEKFGAKAANIYRLCTVSLLMLTLVGCFFFIIVEFSNDIAKQGLLGALVFIALWFVIKFDSWMYQEISTIKADTSTTEKAS